MGERCPGTEGTTVNAPVKMLLIFVNEADSWQGVPLYRAVVQKLLHADLAGATVQPGLIGFGHHHRVHRQGLFGISDDRPVTISAVDAESKIRRVLPEIRRMVQEGLILLLDAELVADAPPAAQ